MDCRDDGQRNLVLHREYTLYFSVITLRPDMAAGLSVDELRVYPNASTSRRTLPSKR